MMKHLKTIAALLALAAFLMAICSLLHYFPKITAYAIVVACIIVVYWATYKTINNEH